jgi:hypothetical protein
MENLHEGGVSRGPLIVDPRPAAKRATAILPCFCGMAHPSDNTELKASNNRMVETRNDSAHHIRDVRLKDHEYLRNTVEAEVPQGR